MTITLSFNGTELTATLDDNETTRDFVSLLPLELTLTDYNQTERISNLPRRLSTPEAGSHQPEVGDITYYAPWGNLAIFYREFDDSPRPVQARPPRLGRRAARRRGRRHRHHHPLNAVSARAVALVATTSAILLWAAAWIALGIAAVSAAGA